MSWRIVSFDHRQRSVVIFAVTPPGRTARENVIDEMILEIARDRLSHPLSGYPTEISGMLAGRTSRVMRWGGFLRDTAIHSIMVSSTVYGIIVSQPQDATPSASHIVRGFRLLE